MSAVYFHSPSGEARLRGAERAYAGGVTRDLTLALLDVPPGLHRDEDKAAWMKLIRPACYLTSMGLIHPDRWWESLRSYLVADGELHHINGKRADFFRIAVNTAAAIGNEPLRFLAKLHAQCELHCWVDGPHREWLAGVIERGRRIGLYRADMGWEDVAALLRANSTEPVVLSYSVCRQFPNPDLVIEEAGDEAWEEAVERWYEQPKEAQWAQAMERLKAAPESGLQIEPPLDDTYGDELTAFDVLAALEVAKGDPGLRAPRSPSESIP